MPFPNVPLEQLLERRNAYQYPAVALAGAPDELTVVRFASTYELDGYLTRLLNADDVPSRLLGYLGVVFWGHYSGQAGRTTERRALWKAQSAYAGYFRKHREGQQRVSGIVDMGVDAAGSIIKLAADEIAGGQYEIGIRTLIQLPQSGFAFASKVCAFTDPTKCGVIDSAIVEQYPEMNFCCNKAGYVSDNSGNRALYGDYCSWLQSIAVQLNATQRFCEWTDRDNQRRPWRAIDVERALYG